MQGYGEKELLNKVKPFRLNCQVNCFLKGVVQLPDFFLALLSLHSAQYHFLSSDTCRFLCCTDSTSQKNIHFLSFCCWDSFHQLKDLRRKKASAQQMILLI